MNDSPARPRRRLRRALIWTGASIGTLLLALVVGILIYANVGVMPAEAGPLEAVRDDPAVVLDETGDSIVLSPAAGDATIGLVFIPGAKVDPLAYAATLAPVVEEFGVTAVITRPTLNLAFFDLRSLDAFTDEVPAIDTWYVGGHSLGGVRACQLADGQGAVGLVLFASYCANDLSASGLRALSLSGGEDGLSTPAKIQDAAHNLPADAQFVEIEGASHANFGAYGPQPGDGTATISDADFSVALTEALGAFLTEVTVPAAQ